MGGVCICGGVIIHHILCPQLSSHLMPYSSTSPSCTVRLKKITGPKCNDTTQHKRQKTDNQQSRIRLPNLPPLPPPGITLHCQNVRLFLLSIAPPQLHGRRTRKGQRCQGIHRLPPIYRLYEVYNGQCQLRLE